MGTLQKKIRIGVVGGGFGAAFQWHLDPNCVVEAVSDLREDRRKLLMDTYKCAKSYNSLEELIYDKKIDAVAVFTPGTLHVNHCVKCLEAGKHVICAVPAAVTLDEAEELFAAVEKTGLTYMMAETSYYNQSAISARGFFEQKKFGNIFYTEAEYCHPGVEQLWFDEDGMSTWRHGYPPIKYITHATGYLVGITGERLASVSCLGWTDSSPLFAGNPYNNTYWNETALFRTDIGNALRVAVHYHGAFLGCERADWRGDKMSFYMAHPNGLGPIIIRSANQTEKDEAGFVRQLPERECYEQPDWSHIMLPESMCVRGGHGGSEAFLTHEFIDALINGRKPAIDIYEALAMTIPGIVAHKSALRDGEQLKIPILGPKS